MTLSIILGKKGRDIVTTAPDQRLKDVALVMADRGIGAVLVVGPEQALLGIISERDVVRSIAHRGAAVLDEAVSNHMTGRVKTATAETGVTEAMELMTHGRFRHLPVMAGDRVDGLVSIGDLVKHRLSEMENENKALVEYITAA